MEKDGIRTWYMLDPNMSPEEKEAFKKFFDEDQNNKD